MDNFAGNEVYFDFVSLGATLDSTAYSPCGLPDLIINDTDDLLLGDINLYPNPATDLLTVEIAQPNNLQNISFEVTNMLGQGILTQRADGQQTIQIQLEGLETGVFYLNILSDNQQVESIKFVKL